MLISKVVAYLKGKYMVMGLLGRVTWHGVDLLSTSGLLKL